MGKTITLCMIVKNEAHVIERCLASMLPLIDHWVIVDTGSTDGTQEKIKNFFGQLGIPGELHEKPWVDFGTNRSQALELARDKADYSIMIDADEIMEFEPNFDANKFKEGLTCDLYNVFAYFGNTKYHRPQLTSNKKKFYYRGVLHEYVDSYDGIDTRDFARGILNRPIQDGARSKNPEKYKKDAETFEKALESGKVDERDFNRYHFYLAQSYRDSGQWVKAYKAYLKRATLGGWNEEVFYSLLQAGKILGIMMHEGKPAGETITDEERKLFTLNVDEAIRIYFNAYQTTPWRAESLFAAARLCRMYSRFDQAYRFAKIASTIKCPEGALFVEQPVYEWGILDELAISAFFCGQHKESKQAAERLLTENKFPPQEKARIEANYKFACDAILNS